MTYKPPLFGHAKMLNFDVTSLPSTGGWMMFVGMILTVVAFFVGKKASKT
jgi:LPXTG-motif cell wall-anchored protein